MIFVTLGSQKFQFNRILKKIDELIEKNIITEKVFAQIGHSDYIPKHYNYKQFLNREEFSNMEKQADLIITHGGTGAIIGAVKQEKKVIAIPRLSKYKEHVDDHQLQIIKQFDDLGFIIPCNNVEDLDKCLNDVKKFKSKKYISNTTKIINNIENYIENINLKEK